MNKLMSCLSGGGWNVCAQRRTAQPLPVASSVVHVMFLYQHFPAAYYRQLSSLLLSVASHRKKMVSFFVSQNPHTHTHSRKLMPPHIHPSFVFDILNNKNH